MTGFIDVALNGRYLPSSATVATAAKVIALRQAGVHVVSFALGAPDQETPLHIREAASRAILAGAGTSHYTEIPGKLALRRVIAETIVRDHGIECDAQQVVVGLGAKQVIFNAFEVLLRPGDEVVIPSPYWTSYPDIVQIAGGKPVIVETTSEQGFVPDPAAIERACTDRTRAIVICSPHNPTGAVYPRDVLRAIGELAARRKVLVLCDVIYRALSFGPDGADAARIVAETGAPILVIDGVSKAYCMTGWRIGWGAGPVELIRAIATLQGQSTANATAASQEATLAALRGPQDCVAELRREFAARREVMLALLVKLPRVSLPVLPSGGFYALPDFRAWLGAKTRTGETLATDADLVRYLLEEVAVAVNPGTPFGAPGFLRFTYATTIPEIEEGMRRLERALALLTPAP